MDKEVLLKAKQGDKHSLGVIFDNYVDRLYRYAYVRLHDKHKAEDIVSTVFIKVIENIATLDLTKNFEAWLFTITRNSLIDYLRKNKFVNAEEYISTAADKNSETKEVENSLIIKDIRSSMQGLKKVEQEVIELTYFAGLNDREVGELINVAEGNIRVIRFRAIKKIKKIMKIK
ncbi:MAG: sigma-70 family RNA polymerase sigma factor [Candidatus Dojkabacteria bacterium]|uniref:Sigma-70 family RNA polymerase sigma factor n=1 Tax=Candidatus Dojkabacteria bacterium TaxID=2099670 RepID=A0A952AHC5_9BACT|nr:sigma-70 family RNA polymerase sigma factor [Candidatus Dojkabacteria bacterium]WKZ28245.1 MAG: sigma-70 family RNA polymerase sigma factor [Candidatus Dojkabacteria bacterium]